MSASGYVKKSSRSFVLPSLKPYKCTNPDCTKSFLNQNGLKYHRAYGTCVKKTAPDASSSDRPYYCYDDACAKAYKNMNGLRYHYLHSAEHGERGMQMLTDGTHPPFLDRSAGANGHSGNTRSETLAHSSASSRASSSQATSSSRRPSSRDDSTASEDTSYDEHIDPPPAPMTYKGAQPMNIAGAEALSPSSVSQNLLDAVNLFYDRPNSRPVSRVTSPQPPSTGYEPGYPDTQQYLPPQNGAYAQYQQQTPVGPSMFSQTWNGQTPWMGQTNGQQNAGVGQTSLYDYQNLLLPYMGDPAAAFSSSVPPQSHFQAQQAHSQAQPIYSSSYAAPPLVTFGARTHRFHPYGTSPRNYLPAPAQFPQKVVQPQSPPRPRRLSL